MQQVPDPPAAPPSVEDLVAQIARQRGGKERLEEARKGGRPAHAIVASERPPPDVAEMEKRQPPPPPRSMRPTRQELEKAISSQAGGREKLERARQGGRPDQPPPRTSAMQRAAEWFAWLPDLITPAHAAGALSLTLTPKTDPYGRHSGLASKVTAGSDTLYAYTMTRGGLIHGSTPANDYVEGYSYQINWDSKTTSKSERPYTVLTLTIPRDGYYIVNMRASSPVGGVQLRRFQSSRYPIGQGYPVVQTFDATGLADRPALLYLTKGIHSLYWVYPGKFTLYSVSVNSYP